MQINWDFSSFYMWLTAFRSSSDWWYLLQKRVVTKSTNYYLNNNICTHRTILGQCYKFSLHTPTPLPAVTALTAQGMTITRLFVVQDIVCPTLAATKYSVKNQTINILNPTPSGDRSYQLLLQAHRSCFLEENYSVFHCVLINHYFSWTIYCAFGRSA